MGFIKNLFEAKKLKAFLFAVFITSCYILWQSTTVELMPGESYINSFSRLSFWTLPQSVASFVSSFFFYYISSYLWD